MCCVQMGPERRRSAAISERDDRGQLERVVRDFRGGVPILSIRRPIRPIRWAWLGLFRPFEGVLADVEACFGLDRRERGRRRFFEKKTRVTGTELESSRT